MFPWSRISTGRTRPRPQLLSWISSRSRLFCAGRPTVVYDATHSLQLPGGQGSSSGGMREYIPHLCRAAVACGVDGIFMEVHPDPDNAPCDGPNMWPMDQLETLLRQLLAIRQAAGENSPGESSK